MLLLSQRLFIYCKILDENSKESFINDTNTIIFLSKIIIEIKVDNSLPDVTVLRHVLSWIEESQVAIAPHCNCFRTNRTIGRLKNF